MLPKASFSTPQDIRNFYLLHNGTEVTSFSILTQLSVQYLLMCSFIYSAIYGTTLGASTGKHFISSSQVPGGVLHYHCHATCEEMSPTVTQWLGEGPRSQSLYILDSGLEALVLELSNSNMVLFIIGNVD